MPRLPWIQRAFSLSLLLGAACSSPSASSPGGGQTGGEEPPGTCVADPGATTVLAPSAKSAAGFSADDVLGKVSELKNLPLTYTGGGSTTLALETQYVGPTGFDSCKQLEVVVNLRFVTADHAFNETLTTTLLAPSVGTAGSAARVAPAALQGSFVSTHEGSAAVNAQNIEFDVSFASHTAHGTVVALGTQAAGSSPIIATF